MVIIVLQVIVGDMVVGDADVVVGYKKFMTAEQNKTSKNTRPTFI